MKHLAEVILEAQRIRENSYDREASKRSVFQGKIIDFNTFYRLSLEESAKKAYERYDYDMEAVHLVYLLIKVAWNDSRYWAKDILENHLRSLCV